MINSTMIPFKNNGQELAPQGCYLSGMTSSQEEKKE